MKSNSISLDHFLTIKEKPRLQVFLFLLDKEYSHLDSEASWINYCRYPTYLVRLKEEEFHMMDIGTHPKTLITKAGKEIAELRGLLSPDKLISAIRSIDRGGK